MVWISSRKTNICLWAVEVVNRLLKVIEHTYGKSKYVEKPNTEYKTIHCNVNLLALDHSLIQAIKCMRAKCLEAEYKSPLVLIWPLAMLNNMSFNLVACSID